MIERSEAFSNDGATYFLFGISLGAPPPVAAKQKPRARPAIVPDGPWPTQFHD
jgi:hypothetical protein